MRASRATRARRRIAFRLETAERAVREALSLLPGSVPADDLERDTRTLGELASLLAEAARAFGPPTGAQARADRFAQARAHAHAREDDAGGANVAAERP